MLALGSAEAQVQKALFTLVLNLGFLGLVKSSISNVSFCIETLWDFNV